MSNVPMYRNTNNIAFGVSVLIVLESLFTLLYRDIESRLSSPYSTGADDDDQDDDEERRGEGQDGDEDSGPSPRPALHEDLGSAFTKLAAKGKEGPDFSSPREIPFEQSWGMMGAVKIPFKHRLGDDGALRRNTESRGPQQPAERDPAIPRLQHGQLDAVQPRVGAIDAHVRSCACHLHHPGVYLQIAAIAVSLPRRRSGVRSHHQTEYIDYTGEKLGNPAYDLPANLYNNNQIVKNLLDITKSRKILRGGANIAALCVRFRHNNNPLFTTSAAVLWSVQQLTPQFAIGRRKALQRLGRQDPAQDHPEGRLQQPRDPGGREGAEEGQGNSPRHRPEDGDSQLGV